MASTRDGRSDTVDVVTAERAGEGVADRHEPAIPSLAHARWTELDRPLLAVPVGSCEQHGPHLPLATDTAIAEVLAASLAIDRPDVLVTPPLAITASGEHAGFPGTLSIGASVMEQVVVELVRSADWATGVVLVNGHGGNRRAVDAAVATLRGEGRRVRSWWPHVPGGDLHAGHTETSLMLAIRPWAVAFEHAVAGPQPTIEELVAAGVAALSPTGVLGDPSGASREHGMELLGSLIADLRRAVDAEWPRPAP